MKKIIFLLLISIPFLYSCDKETEGVSRITYYVDLSLKGSPEVVIPVGGTYTEAGFEAKENGVDVSSNVKITGSVNTATPGGYTLTYSVSNKDGFPKTASRLVVVYPTTNLGTADLSGTYGGQRTGKVYTPSACTIQKIAQGVFLGSDFLGGYYNKVAKYGPDYCLRTYFVLRPDNTIESITNNSAFGPWLILNGKYDPGTGKITYKVDSDGFQFGVTLTKE